MSNKLPILDLEGIIALLDESVIIKKPLSVIYY
jgi:hypothetical protein